ncbi:HD domain-containing protein (plasmid) [Bradyrhizobium sp. 183]|uniref:HD-GYP domain-containing protein n=1 Tax=unclassified Bradyrhizobium TaxID=2631580 RepID=UPI00200009ED|nr:MULTISPECIES: HD domain-containing phosphohydrolase [unclassified Bradyrhizobium]UPJ84884.1 HD domain-containing protein [Bradyrhizobium sp. 184]UPJ92324.1 HD domain-containing protein [Bradyrhizobium sp. 183]
MLVHVLADASDKLFGLCSVLERQFTVAGERLDVEAKLPHAPAAVVIRADLRSVENIAALKRRALRLAKTGKRIFLVEQTSHVCVSQAYALGATLVLSGKIDPTKLTAALSDPAGSEAGSTCDISRPDDAVEVGAYAIASLFTLVTLGERIDVDGTKEAGRMITDRIAEHGLSEWLTTVRRHHEGTYQHCLLVTGVAIDFGLSLGVRKSDLERLSTAAMFHDIGKARSPLAILDKPGRLDDKERALVETHPAAGYDVLKEHGSISPEILDCVRHHHEYLDGSGYPDGFCAESITDIVRILTISDIFAALIEHRRYKPMMPREAAYGILCGMRGKLEKALVSSFKDVALTR